MGFSPTDSLFIYNTDPAGAGGLIYDTSFIGDGSTTRFELGVSTERALSVFVTVDGVKTTATLTDNDGITSYLDFVSAPANESEIHVHAFNSDETGMYGYIHDQTVNVTGNTYPIDYVITLDEEVRSNYPYSDKVLVEWNGSRLRPSNQNYLVADGTTVTYALQSTVDIDPDLINGANIIVTLDGERMLENIDWTLNPSDGSSVRTVTFIETPFEGTEIIISNNYGADYTITNSTTLELAPGLALQSGDTIHIVSFGNHDTLGIRTQVYKSLEVGTTVLSDGFGDTPFDAADFDGSVTITVVESGVPLSRPATNLNYLIVSIDLDGRGGGKYLLPNLDYTILDDNQLIIGGNYTITDDTVIVVTSFTENTVKPSIGYRIFQDMNGNVEYLRIAKSASTRLEEALLISDTTIKVLDASVLPTPNINDNKPGVIFVAGERITYWTKNNGTNTLGQLRRGTAGTGTKDVISANTLVTDGSQLQRIPNSDDGMSWYGLGDGTATNGYGLQFADTIQSNFLEAEPSDISEF